MSGGSARGPTVIPGQPAASASGRCATRAGARDLQATDPCTAEVRELAAAGTLSALGGEVIERVPSVRDPVLQRLVRCAEPSFEPPCQGGAARP